MVPKRGYFQPIDSVGLMSWLWWGVFLMLSFIIWNEIGFKFDIFPIASILVVVLVGLLMIIRRRVYLAGSQIFWGRILMTEYEKVKLEDIDNWQIKGRILSFERADRKRKYLLSRNVAEQIKGYKDTNGR
ncbi:EbsA family protein [Leuconostoc falkenbergense]|uniref:EbsA family protein n=1 Tax=Leuconostoc falkenbergense TaxID=2766470 RepID=A0ABT7RZL2_9LACO|nr:MULTISPECIES: EbsA family protein [Leuconostoc]MDM7646747.1 EbsA family protein [Leuconostoc falkenbergense]MDY5163745.1 EbsA family protein [Leuconostoc falkenbergense]NLT84845.1 hypothetical protein [Leuconostoc sp.]HCU42697.1 hypothetical protein [Leuconostoc pseudomesenteroides]